VREREQALRDAEARFKDAENAPFGFRPPSPHAGPMRRRMHARRMARARAERAPTLRPYSEAVVRAKAAREEARNQLHQLRIELMTADRGG
jgi:hypothetical protein